jgi:hypothetical protein
LTQHKDGQFLDENKYILQKTPVVRRKVVDLIAESPNNRVIPQINILNENQSIINSPEVPIKSKTVKNSK